MVLSSIYGYNITSRLYQGEHTSIYRGTRERDQGQVILKIFRTDYPSPQEVIKIKREYEIVRDLALEGVVRPYELTSYRNRPALVLEDFGGIALSELIGGAPVSIENFFSIAAQLAETVDQLHQNQVIHKDLKPANIIVNPETLRVKITDFGISTRFSRTNQNLGSPRMLEGTLAYMSPEQTGRMNRSIDYRTDFYSLGVTFYELLTGTLPFSGDDPMELVHAHIARMPPPPHALNPQVPEMLSAIVVKLMAKTAEERYQSARGLLSDLERCREEWRRRGVIAPFALAEHDVNDRLDLPQRLYGREDEIALLLETFARASAGRAELLLVAGYAGVGKSALISELHRPITQRRGYFGRGKFDQLQGGMPYSALIEALRDVLRQILAEDTQRLHDMREQMQAALGANGQVIVDVLPEVGAIIGPQPEVPPAGPLEAQNRFQRVFRHFIGSLSRSEHPLVLLIDDLHWADQTSLQLLEALLTDDEARHLLVLGTYRNHAIEPAHPLIQLVAAAAAAGTPIHTITLEPLRLEDIATLLADMLRDERPRVWPLAEAIYAKTRGNPFFIGQFLLTLYADETLHFDRRQRRWTWSLEQITGMAITDNVVDLMAGKIQRLPEPTRHALTIAACFSGRFTLADLATVAERPITGMMADLWPAIDEGLVLPVEDGATALDDGELVIFGGAPVPASYRFLHDRVQQATYSLQSEDQRRQFHLGIGRLLLAQTPEAEQEVRLFDIVNQLNLGRRLMESQAERVLLVRLNLRAAQKAMASAAYRPALTYAQAGLELPETIQWEVHYSLALELHVLAAELAGLNGEFALMNQLINVVLDHAHTLLDEVRGYEVRIRALIAQNRSYEAVELARQVLARLGVVFPKRASQLQRRLALRRSYLLLHIRLLAGRRTIHQLINLPMMNDPRHLAIARLLASVTAAAYNTAPQIHPLLVSKQIELFLRYGNTPVAAYSYTAYGLLLGAMLNNVEAGCAFGQLALDMLVHYRLTGLTARIYLNVHAFILHRRRHIAEALEPLRQGYQVGLDTGDFEFAAICAYAYGYHRLWLGHDLVAVEREMAEYSEAMRAIRRERPVRLNELSRHMVLSLLGNTAGATVLDCEGFQEQELLEQLRSANDRTTLGIFFIYKMMLCFLAGDHEEALKHAHQATELLNALAASLFEGAYYLFHALVHLAHVPQSGALQRPGLLRQAARSITRLEAWARHAPMNYRQKYLLALAEQARVTGRYGEAREHFDEAISSARTNGYVNDEALACELAGQFYLERDQMRQAQLYLRDARYAYLRWGARTRVADLDRRYPELVTVQPTPTIITTTHPLHTLSTITGMQSGGTLDLTTVMKASQAISGEIVLSQLLARLMAIVIENAGAQRGFLILQHNGQMLIEAEGAVDGAQIAVLQSRPISDNDLPLSTGIVNYVARTLERVVLSDAVNEGQFTRDPYVIAAHPRSVLCLPLIYQGKLNGLLYLENNLSRGAFTPERIEVLQLLAAQAAISIENAGLYNNLEQLVAERTTSLTDANAQLKAATARLQAELVLAQRIQRSLLLPSQADWGALELACHTEPAREVGGDFYSYHSFDGRHRVLAIGDISGKGMPAALLMAVSLATLQAIFVGERSPGHLLIDLDELLQPYTRSTSQNCAICYIDIVDDRLRIANAGCISPLVRRADGSLEWVEVGGLPLGVGLTREFIYSEAEVNLAPGDQVVVMSDGVVEAMSATGEMFGFARLERAVAGGPVESAAALMEHLRATVAGFTGPLEAHDDVTIVVLRRR